MSREASILMRLEVNDPVVKDFEMLEFVKYRLNLQYVCSIKDISLVSFKELQSEKVGDL